MSRIGRWARHGRQLVLKGLMGLSAAPCLGWVALRLAEALAGTYKDRRILAQLTARSYVSSRAQVRCGQLRLGHDGVTIYAHKDAGEVRLGDRAHIYRGTIVEVGAGGSIIIGDDTHIQASCNLKGFLGSLIIGCNVQIAPHCGFSPYEHHFEDLSVPIKSQGIRSAGDIVIEDDVWVGFGVQVLEGVRIGKGAVVGAGAVVTKDIPPYAIAVGVPAHVVRLRGEE